MHTEFLHVCPRVGGQDVEWELTHGSVHFLTFSYLIPVTLTQMLRFRPDQSFSRINKIVFCGNLLFSIFYTDIFDFPLHQRWQIANVPPCFSKKLFMIN